MSISYAARQNNHAITSIDGNKSQKTAGGITASVPHAAAGNNATNMAKIIRFIMADLLLPAANIDLLDYADERGGYQRHLILTGRQFQSRVSGHSS